MDVNALGKGGGKNGKKGKYGGKGDKGKVKGKSKDKQKGKTGGARFEGWCKGCGRNGHRVRDCWHSNEGKQVNALDGSAADGAASATGASSACGTAVTSLTGAAAARKIEAIFGECPSGHGAAAADGWILMVG